MDAKEEFFGAADSLADSLADETPSDGWSMKPTA